MKYLLFLENIDHIDQIVSLLGLTGLPADARLRLYGLPRDQAMKEIISLLEERRQFAQKMLADKMASDIEMLKKLIDEGVLEKMDLVEFGKALRDRYLNVLTLQDSLGMPPDLVLGSAPRPAILEDKSSTEKTLEAPPVEGGEQIENDQKDEPVQPEDSAPPNPDKDTSTR